MCDVKLFKTWCIYWTPKGAVFLKHKEVCCFMHAKGHFNYNGGMSARLAKLKFYI